MRLQGLQALRPLLWLGLLTLRQCAQLCRRQLPEWQQVQTFHHLQQGLVPAPFGILVDRGPTLLRIQGQVAVQAQQVARVQVDHQHALLQQVQGKAQAGNHRGRADATTNTTQCHHRHRFGAL
ncbi:hypothetical protein D3C84_1001460 [compost metagenome]